MPIMQELAEAAVPDDTDIEFFSRIVAILDENYPQGWRSWEVEDFSYVDLFGTRISSMTEQKLRFAIPTAELGQAFSPSDPTLSEKKYRIIKRKLLNWGLGRALIYSPHSVMEKLHKKSYEPFMSTVKILRPRLISRKRSITPNPAPSISKRPREHPSTNETVWKPRSISPERNSKDTSSFASHRGEGFNEEMHMAFYEKMLSVLTKNSEVMASVADQVSSLSAKIDNNGYESEVSSGSDIGGSDRDPVNKIGNAPTTVSVDDALIFAPCTAEAESKLTKAIPRLVEQDQNCQRLGHEGWRNVRYAEVQKNFHATPVFSALKVNSVLATNTPSWTSLGQLEKSDLTLGAISYGLLLQRAAFEDAYKKLEPSSRKDIQKHFLDNNTEFKKISDNLLQYTCGRRAEVIQARRETYKCPNKILNDLLHDIPPSNTHLFCEDKLSEIIKEQGGAYKFFPKKIPKTNIKKGFKSVKRPLNLPKTGKRQSGRNFRPSWKNDNSGNKHTKATQPAERKP